MPMQTPSSCAPPLISFVVPVYNVLPRWLETCIHSILALPLEASMREIIVVDDGSREPVAPQLESLGADVCCVRQPNRGLSEARNRGIQLASAAYIQFVDADDCLLPHAYAHCIRALQAMRPDIVCFRLTRSCEPSAPSVPLAVPASLPSGTDYMLHHNLRASACGYLFRKDILGGLCFPSGLLHEDEDFTPRLFLAARTVCDLPIAAYYYRPAPQSITSDTRAPRVARRLDSKQQVLVRLSRLAVTLPAHERAALCRRIAQLSMDLLADMLRLRLPYDEFLRRVELLRQEGFYPLPLKGYTFRYCLFAWLSRWKTLLFMLYRAEKQALFAENAHKL